MQDKQYVYIIPHYTEKNKKPTSFLLSHPDSLMQCRSYALQWWWNYEPLCPVNKIRLVECHIPNDVFSICINPSTRCFQWTIDKFFKLNEKYNPANQPKLSENTIFNKKRKHHSLPDNMKPLEENVSEHGYGLR